MGSKLAEDAYQGLKRAVGRLLGRDQEQDTASGLQVVLEADLPEDADQQLAGLDLARFRLGPLHPDRQQARWRSELDEARPAT